MRYLDRIESYAKSQPDAPAIRTSLGRRMSYGELWHASGALAGQLRREVARDGVARPVVVYGHKDPLMVASFVACMRAGLPYVPIDRYSVPAARVASILNQLVDPLVLAVSPLPMLEVARPVPVVTRDEIAKMVDADEDAVDAALQIDGEDLCYILFTSGSTGAPKGVEVTASCFDNFCSWSTGLGAEPRPGRVYLDQAPFSFDLSVFELAGALATGGSLYSLEHDTQASMGDQIAALAASGVNVWVSTPSFADMCLANAAFNESLMLGLELFLFCGETLSNRTASLLLERFAGAEVINTYGPTESTVAVSEVRVTPQMAAAPEPLPVGAPRPGTRLRIVAPDGSSCSVGECGEVVIEGDTVARGYYGRPDLTARSFGERDMDGKMVRSYRTGDEGWLDESGMLHYRGRLDLQVKLNGYRIELGEIEEQLRRLPEVAAAAVTTVERDGHLSHLVAHVVSSVPRRDSDFRCGLALKRELKATLPHYMIPKKIVFLEALPMTGNGKVDRRALAEGGR